MPEKPTLVVVDVQQAFDDPFWGKRNNPGAEGNVARLLAAWRAADAPVIHVRHREPDPDPGWHFFHEGDPGFEFKPEAMPVGDEPVITKGVNSAFIGTDLEERLRAAGATFDREGPDGEFFPADLIHRTALASLHDEFADVVSTHEAIARLW